MNNYNAEHIQSLKGIEHIRLRPSMYIGNTGIKGLHHLLNEVIDNSIDEYLEGYCNKIIVTIYKNNFIEVEDNGRGIPVDYHKKEKKSALEVVLTKIGSGAKFDKKNYKISGGLHGVGISCVNALSKKFIATIYRNNKIYQQKYKFGKPISPIEIIGNTNKIGTKIKFLFDDNIIKEKSYNYEIIFNRLRELSFLNKGLKLLLIDKINNKEEVFYSKKGLKEFLIILDKKKEPVTKKIISIKKKYKNNLFIDIVLRYNESLQENIFSYVNNIKTEEGGTHVLGFKKAIFKVFKKFINNNNNNNKNNKNKIYIINEDILEGLTAILSIYISDPQFEGQTKTKLVNKDIIKKIEILTINVLSNFLEENPKYYKKIFYKICLSARARIASKKARELINLKVKTNYINNTPIKLSDCSLNNPKLCEIYLVEGDSAGGTAKQGRDRNFQAVLPLRGKILNVEKSIVNKVFENEEIKNIFTSLRISFNDKKNHKEFDIDISRLKYHKIIIMTDADVDGSHISTLLLTFFFRYMKKLIINGHIYIATPPLFLIKQNEKNKMYAWNEKQKNNLINKFFNNKKIIIHRYKGLGEMNANQLWETTMNPENRFLRKIYIHDEEKADKVCSMLMSHNVFPRKKFIEKYALNANTDI